MVIHLLQKFVICYDPLIFFDDGLFEVERGPFSRILVGQCNQDVNGKPLFVPV